MCYPVCGTMHIKTLAADREQVVRVAAAGFLSRYLSDPLPDV